MGTIGDMEELPQDLKDAQDRISKFYKDQRLTSQIGKFYSAHSGPGYPTKLRRIYLDANGAIRVDHYTAPKGVLEFNFKSWVITEELNDANQREFREVEDPKTWYNCLKMLIRFPQIESVFIEKELEEENKHKSRVKELQSTIEESDRYKKVLNSRIDDAVQYLHNTNFHSDDSDNIHKMIRILRGEDPDD